MTDIAQAIAIAHKWVEDPKRHPNSERVIMARAFLDIANRLADMMDKEREREANVAK